MTNATLRLQDVRELEAQLRAAGEVGSLGPAEFIAEATGWFGLLKAPRPLDQQTFAELCEAVRGKESSAETAQLARGAMRIIRSHSESRRDLVEFIARFALHRISDIRSRGRRWNSVFIPDLDYRNTVGLFEIAKSDTSYTTEMLVATAHAFIESHPTGTDLFGRFAQDLERLVDVLTDAGTLPEHKAAARGALVYFAESTDAIADSLGPVGLLDDVIVAAQALAKIYPDRVVLAAFLDDVVARWPFLLDLVFEFEGHKYPLSEYLAINMGLARQTATGDDSTGVVTVLDNPGPLPYVIGFVIALTHIFDSTKASADVDFEVGERLVDRSTLEEFIFEGYVSEEYQPTTRTHAKYFKVRQPQRKTGGKRLGAGSRAHGDVTFSKPIEQLAALQRSSKESRTLNTGTGQIDVDRVPLSVLERLFARVSPLTIPDDISRVVVVAPPKQCRDLGKSMSILGTPILDIVPTGSARLGEDFELQRWSSTVAGRAQVVTVVRTVAEALELAETEEHNVGVVIATIRPDTTDAANAKSIAQRGVRILSVVGERDAASHDLFDREAFRFWTWHGGWLDHLHWPGVPHRGSKHPLAAHESSVRTTSVARVHIEEISDAGIQEAHGRLQEFEARLDTADETQQAALGSAYYAFVTLLRELHTPPDDSILLERFSLHLQAARYQWPDGVLQAGQAALKAISAAAAQVRRHNGKLEFLRQWATRNPNGIVLATNKTRRRFASEEDAFAALRWTNVLKHGSTEDAVLVTGWQSKVTEGLLFPPVARDVTVALYGPERGWLESARTRNLRVKNRLSTLSRSRSALPRTTTHVSPGGDVGPLIPRYEPSSIDQILAVHRRERALSVSASDATDLVEARLVYFVGGNWAAFSPEAHIHTFTHLLESDSENEIPRRAVEELQGGDRVLMVRGSARDAVAVAADKYLPPGTRTSAGLWQAALRRYIEGGRSIAALHRSLAQAACKRTVQTVRGWVMDEYRIGPQDPVEPALQAIAAVTGDRALEDRCDSCAEAIRRVRSAHVRAGYELQQQVLGRVRDWLGSGASPDEVLEVEEQVFLLTVESVDPQLALAPRNQLNQLREES